MSSREKRVALLYLLAGICFLLPAGRYIFVYGFPGFSNAPEADLPFIAVAQLIAGTLFVLRSIMDMRKGRTQTACRPLTHQ